MLGTLRHDWRRSRRTFDESDAAAIEPYIGVLRRFAMGLSHDADFADDLVQGSLGRAADRWHLRTEDGDLKTWLFGIVYRQFINGRRPARCGIPASGIGLPFEPAATRGEERPRPVDVLRAVERLSDEHRALILLIDVEEVSYDAAARILGTPIGMTMSRLSRAREQLRHLLAGQAAA